MPSIMTGLWMPAMWDEQGLTNNSYPSNCEEDDNNEQQHRMPKQQLPDSYCTSSFTR